MIDYAQHLQNRLFNNHPARCSLHDLIALAICLLLGTLSIGCQMTPRYQTPATRDNVLSRMDVRIDGVDGIRWYHHKSSDIRWSSNAPMEVYIGQQIERPQKIWLRVRTYWSGSRWRFFNGLTVNTNGMRYNRNRLIFKRDFASGTYRLVKETIDLPVGLDEYKMIRAIIDSDTAVLRLRGERGNHDYAFTANDRLIYRDVLTAFEALENATTMQRN